MYTDMYVHPSGHERISLLGFRTEHTHTHTHMCMCTQASLTVYLWLNQFNRCSDLQSASLIQYSYQRLQTCSCNFHTHTYTRMCTHKCACAHSRLSEKVTAAGCSDRGGFFWRTLEAAHMKTAECQTDKPRQSASQGFDWTSSDTQRKKKGGKKEKVNVVLPLVLL